MTASDPFYSLNVFFSNIAFSEMKLLDKMQGGSESDLNNSGITETTSIIGLILRKKVLDLHAKMLQQNLHSLKSRGVLNWAQDSEAGDWSQADAMTQRLQVDFEHLLLRTKYLSARCDHDLNSIMRSPMIDESRNAISQTSSTVRNLTRLALLYALLSFLASLFGMNLLEFCMEKNISVLSSVMFATLFMANLGISSSPIHLQLFRASPAVLVRTPRASSTIGSIIAQAIQEGPDIRHVRHSQGCTKPRLFTKQMELASPSALYLPLRRMHQVAPKH